MEFKEFAFKLWKIYGGGEPKGKFARTLFFSVVSEDAEEIVANYSDVTMRSFFNGSSPISGIAKRILPYSDFDEFESSILELPEPSVQLITEAFIDSIPDITMHNYAEKISELFKEILLSAADGFVEENTDACDTENKTPRCSTVIGQQNNVIQIGDSNVNLINNGEITINL